MSRASVFLLSLGVGTWLAVAGLGGCSSSNNLPEMDPTSQDSGASPGNGGGLSSVTDGTDAGAAVDSGSGNGGSGDVAPAPLLSAIAPTFAAVGGLGPTLIVKGSSFTAQSVVRVDGTELATTFFSNAEIHAAIPNDKLLVATTLHISVKTPAPGGGSSADLPFEVRNPTPALTTLAPSSALAGSDDAPLTLSGNAFAPNPAVYFDGNALTITSASASSVSSLIPSALLKASGSHNVTVVNGAPGGGTSNAISFTVSNPTVTIASVTPASATVNDAAKSLSIVGSGFISATSIAFNGTTLSSTFIDGSHITAVAGASSFTNAGNFSVVATNPAPGGGVSSPAPFQVINPAPQIATLTPNTVFYGATDTTITINGSAFVPTSVAKLGTSSLTTAFVSSTQLTAVVPASALSSLTTLSVTVFTPAPGGGTSSASPLYITCDSTNVDVPLGAVSNITTRNVFYSGPDVNHVASAACPQTALSGFVEPIAQWVVQNNTTSPVVLSSWAVCATTSNSQSDGFLATYRGGTVPATDAARMQCATVGSEGALGSSGNYSSPDANGSNWCPGLTKANGAGITLAACEKAVVTLQPYSVASTTQYPAPTQIRFEPESP